MSSAVQTNPRLSERRVGDFTWGLIERIRDVIVLLEAGDYPEETVERITVTGAEVAAVADWKRNRSVALTLLDFLIDRDRESAAALAGLLRTFADDREIALVRREAPQRLTDALEMLGISDEELAANARVKPATVRRWKRGACQGNRTVESAVELCFRLRKQGLDEEGIRRFMEAPHPRLEGDTPRNYLFSRRIAFPNLTWALYRAE